MGTVYNAWPYSQYLYTLKVIGYCHNFSFTIPSQTFFFPHTGHHVKKLIENPIGNSCALSLSLFDL
jgi:hypothetical protein